MTGVKDLQKALEQLKPKVTPVTTTGSYQEGYLDAIHDAKELFSAFQKEYDKQVHPSRKQLSEEAFCLHNFDDEETPSKCKSECIFGQKPFDLSLCRHTKNQDLVIRISKIQELVSGFEETHYVTVLEAREKLKEVRNIYPCGER